MCQIRDVYKIARKYLMLFQDAAITTLRLGTVNLAKMIILRKVEVVENAGYIASMIARREAFANQKEIVMCVTVTADPIATWAINNKNINE
ncbi:unnamed protein product [Ilex paraguariensis]|uniref:Uncharacterized protein n=1 Tax=Ilex paraguariensis TaxID=185542 RepID=A0ABC8R0D3_9AQUA